MTDNKRGFTLAEVILACAILGLVAMTIGVGGSSMFRNLAEEKAITKKAYEAVGTLETDSDNIHKAVEKGGALPANQKTVTLFDGKNKMDVAYFPLTADISPKENLSTAAAKYKRAPLDSVTATSAVFDSAPSTEISAIGDFVVGQNAALSVTVGLAPDHMDIWQADVSNWYQSKPGFYAITTDDKTGYNPGELPSWPADYIHITGASGYTPANKSFTVTPDYAGTRVMYTVYTVATSGKIGNTLHSRNAYVLPLDLQRVTALYDASLINQNPYILPTLGEWDDVTGAGPAFKADALPPDYHITSIDPDPAKAPGCDYKSVVKYLSFAGGKYMSQPQMFGLTNVNNFTMYIVARLRQGASGGACIMSTYDENGKAGGFELKPDELDVYDSNSKESIFAVDPSHIPSDGGWCVYKLEFTGGGQSIGFSFNGDTVPQSNPPAVPPVLNDPSGNGTADLTDKPVYIGANPKDTKEDPANFGADIAEIIVVDTASGAAGYSESDIYGYLKDKFKIDLPD